MSNVTRYRKRKVGTLSVVCERVIEALPFDTVNNVIDYWNNVITKNDWFDAGREQMVCIVLDTKIRPIGHNIVSIGAVDHTLCDLREVFRCAIVARAYGIVLIHNHPSGDPTPSHNDTVATRKVRDAGDMLGIRVIDHVIFGTNPAVPAKLYSYKEHGLIG